MGWLCVLQDTTNTVQPEFVRQSKAVAQDKIEKAGKLKHRRGDSSLGARNKWRKEGEVDPSSSGSQEKQLAIKTLKQLIQHDYETFSNGSECLDEYVERNTSQEINKALALKVFQTAISTWGERIIEASQRAADVSDNCVVSVRKWAVDYYTSLVGIPPSEIDDDTVESILLSRRGRSVRNAHSLIRNDEFCVEARKYVRDNANKKGEPNLTSDVFRDGISKEHDCEICRDTARKWLHKQQVNHTKGVYFDGHEREDVVNYRTEFLDKVEELDRKCIYEGHTPRLFEGEKPLIHIHHDESTFFSNADQKCYWADGSTAVLKQKSLGQSIMVSDFIEEAGNDFLSHDGSEARLLLENTSRRIF